MPNTLKQQISAWEKDGRALLDTLLDSFAPFVREYVDDEGFEDDWPDDPEEIWLWISADLLRLAKLDDYGGNLISAYGNDDCTNWTEKLALLIMEKWPSPNDVPNAPRNPPTKKT